MLLESSAPLALGRHPWHAWPPITLDTTAATALGHHPATDDTASFDGEVAWLLEHARVRDGAAALPAALAHPSHEHAFDCAAEDAHLAEDTVDDEPR